MYMYVYIVYIYIYICIYTYVFVVVLSTRFYQQCLLRLPFRVCPYHLLAARDLCLAYCLPQGSRSLGATKATSNVYSYAHPLGSSLTTCREKTVILLPLAARKPKPVLPYRLPALDV